MLENNSPTIPDDTFLCPDCRNPILGETDAYYCSVCKCSYPVISNVISLLPKEIPEATAEDVRAWDDVNSGRVEHQPSWLALVSKEAEIRQCQKIIKEYFNPPAPGRILEVGGGMCWGSMLFKQTFPESYIVSTDIAVSALIKARAAASMAKVTADRYVACDVQSLPFPDNYFDVCFGSEVLHHLLDPVVGLKEIRRVLKPNGKYIGMGEGHATLLLRLMLEWSGLDRTGTETQKYKMQEKLYSARQWEKFFEKAGFSKMTYAINKDPSYQYSSRARLAFFLFISCLPNWLIKSVLGSAIVICAEK